MLIFRETENRKYSKLNKIKLNGKFRKRNSKR